MAIKGGSDWGSWQFLHQLVNGSLSL